MSALQQELLALRTAIREGQIPRAYQALIGFMNQLRSKFGKEYPDAAISNLYQGRLDVTYFAISPQPFKRHSLKIALVFNYVEFRFEAWLAGNNRAVSKRYWLLAKDFELRGAQVLEPEKGVGGFIKADLVTEPDFSDFDDLAGQIDTKLGGFIAQMELFLEGRAPL